MKAAFCGLAAKLPRMLSILFLGAVGAAAYNAADKKLFKLFIKK